MARACIVQKKLNIRDLKILTYYLNINETHIKHLKKTNLQYLKKKSSIFLILLE